MRIHNEKLQSLHLNKMLQVYQIQREKSNIVKINERLKYIHVLKQSLPVISNLIETGSNFEVVIDLITNSQEIIETKLIHLKVANIFKERLSEYQARCRKKMEGECLSLIELQLKGRVQFKSPKITGNQEYRQNFLENIKFYFDNQNVMSKVNLEFIHKGWTLNFNDCKIIMLLIWMLGEASLYQRIKTLIQSLLKNEEIEQQFLRVLKQFYINNGKKLYAQLLDYIMMNAVANQGAEVKSKKEVFKYVNEQSDQNLYNCMILLALLVTQLLTSLSSLEMIAKDAVSEHQKREAEERSSDMSQKEKMIMDRRHENFVKNIVSEFQDTSNKLRHFFTVKIEKNWKRLNDKLQS